MMASAIKNRIGQPNANTVISYECPAPEHSLHCITKDAPGKDTKNPAFPSMNKGIHWFNLMEKLQHVQTEKWIGGRATRADIAGLDKEGKVLWAIEIKRSNASEKAVKQAEKDGYPLFIIDLGYLPKSDDKTPSNLYLKGSNGIAVTMDNIVKGFMHYAKKAYNVPCPRESLGMQPKDHTFTKWATYTCTAQPNCANGCDKCAEVTLHECGSEDSEYQCPDEKYMMQQGIGPLEMYQDPIHAANSHTQKKILKTSGNSARQNAQK